MHMESGDRETLRELDASTGQVNLYDVLSYLVVLLMGSHPSRIMRDLDVLRTCSKDSAAAGGAMDGDACEAKSAIY